MASYGKTSLAKAIAAAIQQAAAKVMLAGAAIAAGAPNAHYADTGLYGATSAVMSQSAADTALAGVTVAYTVGAPAVFTQRAFGFSYDGHDFYVLHLGQEGTFVYDLTTRQWSQFQTDGYDTWNMEYGVKWNDYIVGGSLADGSMWKLDDSAFVDENFRAITRIVTGGIPQRARKTQTNYSVSVNGAVGYIDEDSDTTIQLEVSDDGGVSFVDCGTITLSTTDPKQELRWISLGMITAPGRVYRFTDTGSLRRIDDAEAEIEGEDDNPDNS